VDALEEKLKAASGGKPFEICRYEKEGHAFINHDEFPMTQVKKLGFPGAFAEENRELAWSRVSEFLKKHLY
jgi:dienelactone hydrolase